MSKAQLAKCPYCQNKIRQERLEAHIANIHPRSVISISPRFKEAPPKSRASEKDFYILVEGEHTGPFSEKEVRKMLSINSISLDDHGWIYGMPDWSQLKNFSEFYVAPPVFVTMEKVFAEVKKQEKNEWKELGKGLLVFIFLIFAFAAVANIYVSSVTPSAEDELKASQARDDVNNMVLLLGEYERANGTKPTTEQGLGALVAFPHAEPRPKQWRQLTNSIPIDPWGRKYVYRYPKGDLEGFELFSLGKDGREGKGDVGKFFR